MKIQHWAIIFIILVLPFSIICRNTITKKNWLLRDETRINNVVDNATYDAVSQIIEVAEELEYGKNIPLTEGVLDAAIDRFFNTLSVNFNMPIGRGNAEEYFSPYIPAIVIVGYDGLYVYSYERTSNGLEFSLKPKIPYACTYQLANGKNVTINFTLDNYVKIYFPDDVFLKNAPDANGVVDTAGTHILSGYIRDFLDVDGNNIDDLNDFMDATGFITELPAGQPQYTGNDDPYSINVYPDAHSQAEYIKNTVPMFTDNLAYVLKEWAKRGSGVSPNTANLLTFLYEDYYDSADGQWHTANQDFVFNDDGDIVTYASAFHELRRNTIVDLITNVLTEEFNEHNDFMDTLGITYHFAVPAIGRDQWNNTIDDISVLAFFQGLPIGSNSYYNNYSLGGTRIVRSSNLYAERVLDQFGNVHKVYHKDYCIYIPRDANGNILYGDVNSSTFQTVAFPDGTVRRTTGIEQIYVNTTHAKEAGYYVCSHCM